jgi:hypothetical protein
LAPLVLLIDFVPIYLEQLESSRILDSPLTPDIL